LERRAQFDRTRSASTALLTNRPAPRAGGRRAVIVDVDLQAVRHLTCLDARQIGLRQSERTFIG